MMRGKEIGKISRAGRAAGQGGERSGRVFRIETRTTPLFAAFRLLALIYHGAVRSVRRSHGNALVGLLLNILQTVILIAGFYVMMTLLGMRQAAIRGDFVLYLMTGVFLFMTNTKTSGAVSSAEGPASPMMLHAPMNPIVAIGSAALAALYTQVLSMVVVLYVYHVAFTPITIVDPVGLAGMVLLAWVYGIGVGMIFLAVRPWWPAFASVGSSVYSRFNMIASGKMFTANTLSYWVLALFSWNPLFHIIDQARGYTFENYFPRYTSISYPAWVSVALIMLGLMAEFFNRRRVSASWFARR